jgi:Uma2 family endonuclease
MNERSVPQPEKKYTADDYLRREKTSSIKHELADGKIVAVAAANRVSNLIATNTAISLGSRTAGGHSEIYVNGMMVKIGPGRFTYPNVTIVSGEPDFADGSADILLNPTIILEVFSGSTSSQDKSEKLECVLAMPSIRECLLVKEDEMRVEHYAKQTPKQWIYRIYDEREDGISLESINCKITLAEIYAHIKFQATDVKSQAVN